MDTSNFRPEIHVAQQSRRDKLRIQHDSNPPHYHSAVYVNSLEQLPAQDGLNYEPATVRSCRPGTIFYDPSEICSEMLNFPVNSQGLLAHRDGLVVDQESDKRVGDSSFGNFFRTMPTTFGPSATVSGDPQYFSTWKSIGSQSTADWAPNQSPSIVGEGLSGPSLKIINNTSLSTSDVKPYLGYQELHSASNNPSTEISGPNSPSLYQNALQELVTSSNVQSFGLELASLRQKSSSEETNHGPWMDGGGELLLLPAYATDQLRLKSLSGLMRRPAEGCPQWRSEQDYASARSTDHGDLRTAANDNSNAQALSLSLSSVPSPKVHATQIASKYSPTHLNNIQDFRTWKPEHLSSSANISTGGKILGSAHHDMGTQALTHRNHGPLGPFTGYATILRSSKFLRPAQQLLDELCCFSRPNNVETCEVPDKMLEEVRVSSAAVGNAELTGKGAGDSGGSSFPFNYSNDMSREPAEGVNCSTDSCRPENLHKKARLLYMQDEVCKTYKQYHQQVQMVVSSFESVAGLSAATPYVSLALKVVSKHFRCLKNAITDQLKSIRSALGEDLSSLVAGTSSSKDEASASMLKFFDQSLQKHKGAGGLGCFLESQHIWRPQRGLPERAVSILRAWLFDHFLHPYPTDTDKHMLATQTGLTRNQVSNWFINARVRVWKPMVEEIHMLETKGLAESGLVAGKAAKIGGCDQAHNTNQSLVGTSTMQDKQEECSSISPPERKADRSDASAWNQDKKSRLEYHIPSSVGGSLMGLVPGIEIGGLGAVSLTLGLRQSAENAQRPPLQEHHLRPHLGGQIIRDFVG